MDIATLLGIIIGLVLTVVTMWMSSGGELGMFVDYASIFMVLGGSIAATLVQLPLNVVITGIKVTGKTFSTNILDPKDL